MKDYYVYIYLNPLKSSTFKYQGKIFKFQPIYVGIGRKSRYLAHIRKFKKGEYINPYFKNTLGKIYKSEQSPIIEKLYENLSRGDACKIEINMIYHFGRKNIKTGILTNMTKGGDHARLESMSKQFKPVISFDLHGNKLKEFNSVKEAASYYKCSVAAIGGCCRKILFTATGIIFRYKADVGDKKKINISFLKKSKGKIGKRDKKIYQYNLNGKFIRKWNTISEAAKYHNISESNLTYALKDNVTVINFIWKYDKTPIKNFSKIQIHARLIYATPIIQYDKNGLFIKEYKSINECSMNISISIRWIKKICDGKQQHRSNIRWFYKNKLIEIHGRVPKKINKLKTYNIIVKATRNNEQNIFNSIKEASEFYNISMATVRRCLNNFNWKPDCGVKFTYN